MENVQRRLWLAPASGELARELEGYLEDGNVNAVELFRFKKKADSLLSDLPSGNIKSELEIMAWFSDEFCDAIKRIDKVYRSLEVDQKALVELTLQYQLAKLVLMHEVSFPQLSLNLYSSHQALERELNELKEKNDINLEHLLSIGNKAFNYIKCFTPGDVAYDVWKLWSIGQALGYIIKGFSRVEPGEQGAVGRVVQYQLTQAILMYEFSLSKNLSDPAEFTGLMQHLGKVTSKYGSL